MRLTGSGTAEVAAYGIADAEHALEKELKHALPDAVLKVREVRRMDAEARVVESFRLSWELVTEVEVEADDEAGARSAAYAKARAPLLASPFARIAWEPKVSWLPVPPL